MATSSKRVEVNGLAVAAELHAFVADQVLPGLEVSEDAFWNGFAELVTSIGPKIADALSTRELMQHQIDAWHRDRPGPGFDAAEYRAFLESIGYLVPVGDDFSIGTENVDPEIATVAGPQLVVPISNARYSLNAANARWGSLYDALYGTDALGSSPPPGDYDPERGKQVVAWARHFLDEAFPLAVGSHVDARGYAIGVDGELKVDLTDGTVGALADRAAFAGFTGARETPTSVLLDHHGLGVIIEIDAASPIGAADAAGVKDVVIESAVTTIIDFEDSVAAVDAQDKVAAYGNWLGLMRGDLATSVTKGGETFERRLAENLEFNAVDGSAFARRGRSLLLVRNVGNLMTSDAILDPSGAEIPETLLDAMLTVAIAMHDLSRDPALANSPAGSVYVVKPKMHGPAEVALTDEMFTLVETVLGLARNTVKVGIMDEERRTTVNLKECIRAARHRVAFINTGFLDRTGDEMHTSMEAGPMVRKADMRAETWIGAYENWNVDTGLACGLRGRAQIGKGMWAAPDNMAEMLAQKIGHPRAGANTAWVPSPTAATLHATHYHQVDVAAVQAELAVGGPRATLEQLLTIPLAPAVEWSEEDRRAEVDNNAQGILGYVSRWVEQGIGCSKVPDIHDVALMEDRATCRISSQHIANWLRHGVVGAEMVDDSLQRMAAVVDEQNAGDASYEPMAPGFDNQAYQAARELVFEGTVSPSGYTEPILHARRRAEKARQSGS